MGKSHDKDNKSRKRRYSQKQVEAGSRGKGSASRQARQAGMPRTLSNNHCLSNHVFILPSAYLAPPQSTHTHISHPHSQPQVLFAQQTRLGTGICHLTLDSRKITRIPDKHSSPITVFCLAIRRTQTDSAFTHNTLRRFASVISSRIQHNLLALQIRTHDQQMFSSNTVCQQRSSQTHVSNKHTHHQQTFTS